MRAAAVLAVVLLRVAAAAGARPPELHMSAMDLIAHWGYAGERHVARTADGWLLELHRITRGRDERDAADADRPVLILQHGIMCSSDNWLLNLPHQSAGFVFADAGFDVWLPNSRMNVYTRLENHTDAEPAFWSSTHDDMIKYDLDAVFDHIERVTGQTRFHYVGHSQGTVLMFGKLAAEPGFARRVRAFFALGPAVTFGGLLGPFRALCHTLREPVAAHFWAKFARTRFGFDYLRPAAVRALVQLTCMEGRLEGDYCAALFYAITGTSVSTNVTRLPIYLSHIPAGVSTATVHHYCQQVLNGRFSHYDFPTEQENVEHYGSTTVPDYDIGRIRDVDVYLFYSPLDYFTTEADLRKSLLPGLRPDLVKAQFRLDDFAHMDFLWSVEAADRVYRPIIDIVRRADRAVCERDNHLECE